MFTDDRICKRTHTCCCNPGAPPPPELPRDTGLSYMDTVCPDLRGGAGGACFPPPGPGDALRTGLAVAALAGGPTLA